MDSLNIFSFTYLLLTILFKFICNLEQSFILACPHACWLKSLSATFLLEQIQLVQIACYIPGRKAYFHLCMRNKDLEGVLIGLLLSPWQDSLYHLVKVVMRVSVPGNCGCHLATQDHTLGRQNQLGPHFLWGIAVFGGWVLALRSLPSETSLNPGRGGTNHLPLALQS